MQTKYKKNKTKPYYLLDSMKNINYRKDLIYYLPEQNYIIAKQKFELENYLLSGKSIQTSEVLSIEDSYVKMMKLKNNKKVFISNVYG